MRRKMITLLILAVIAVTLMSRASAADKKKAVVPQNEPCSPQTCREMAIMLKDLAYLMQGTDMAKSNIYVRQRCQEIMDKCGDIVAMIKDE